MKLLLFTQALDERDSTLSAYHRLVSEIAKNFSEVTAICLKEGEHHLPSNVTVKSLGKESGGSRLMSRLRYVIRFYKYIFSSDYDAVFVHMNQEYILLGGVFWKLMGKRIYMWRNHHAGSVLTDIAAAFCTKVFCTSKFSYTASYTKTILMPVGIDTDFFKPDESVKRIPRSVLFLGRVSPVKRPDLLIHALADIKASGKDFTATIVGDSLPKDEGYRSSLVESLKTLGLEKNVSIVRGVPNKETANLYRAHDIFVNLSSSGMYDKTIFEAMACGCLVIASNENLRGQIDDMFIFKQGDKEGLEERLGKILDFSIQQKMQESAFLRNLVIEGHSLKLLGTRLSDLIR